MRWVFRLVVALLVGLVAGLAPASRLSAASSWCEGDPLIEIGNRSFSIVTRIPREALGELTGDVEMVVTVPREHPPVYVSYPFQGPFHENVVIADGAAAWNTHDSNIVILEVFVPSRTSFPIQLVIAGDAGDMLVVGQSGEWICIPLTLPMADRVSL
jgi:hypothetical protein